MNELMAGFRLWKVCIMNVLFEYIPWLVHCIIELVYISITLSVVIPILTILTAIIYFAVFYLILGIPGMTILLNVTCELSDMNTDRFIYFWLYHIPFLLLMYLFFVPSFHRNRVNNTHKQTSLK